MYTCDHDILPLSFIAQHVSAYRFKSVSAKYFIMSVMPQVLSYFYLFICNALFSHLSVDGHLALNSLGSRLGAYNQDTHINSSLNRM